MVTKKPYTEEMIQPKTRKDPVRLTTEEIQHLAKLAEKEGHIEFRSAQHIKTLSKGSGVNQAKHKVKPPAIKHKKYRKKIVHC